MGASSLVLGPMLYGTNRLEEVYSMLEAKFGESLAVE
jgi:hypothetical protein